MKKTCLMNGFAALALGLAVVGCSHESDGLMPTKADQIANAAEKLGVEIDPNQDWNMTGKVTANVSVNLGFDQQYTVGVYDVNPLIESNVHFYAKQTVKEGETAEMTFEAPSAENSFYVAVFDSKNRYLVQTVKVVDGKMEAVFGANEVSASRRATEAEYADSYAKTLNDFLNPTVETCAQFVSQNDQLKNIVSSLEVVDKTLSASTMHQYTAFTDADLAKQSTLSDLIYEKGTQGTTTTETAEYKVASGYNPAAGTTVNVMNGSTKVGTMTFGNKVTSSAKTNVYKAIFNGWNDLSQAGGKITTNASCQYYWSGAKYNNVDYSQALNLDSDEDVINISTTGTSTITIVQATYRIDNKTTVDHTLLFDNNTLSTANADVQTNCRA